MWSSDGAGAMRAGSSRVWITRAKPAADATAMRVRARGLEPLVAPLLIVHPIEGVALDLDGVGALAFTSANAIPAFAALTSERSLPVFAVGEATAAAARTAGFAHVVAADGDVSALAHRVAADGDLGLVLHPGALEPAGDLAAALTAAGIEARNLPVYRTEAAGVLPPAVGADPPGAVLLHSPKAARALAALIPPHWPPAMEALALSPACAAPLVGRGFRRLEAARLPNEAALLALLEP
ncbi:MAG TPA: uroporphyrinogen-III synthase [Caulobacteraceae bacterium]|nr:uroporphyrinogen-III synthase [Caulobacteraceae bacterium]